MMISRTLALVAALAAASAAMTDAALAQTTAAAKTSGRPLFAEAPVGDYDGPVKTIYTADNAPATPKIEDLPFHESVTQYGITWTFDKPARVGRFITGDCYVVGPVTITKISPKPLFGQEVVDSPDWQLVNENAVREDKYKDQWARNGSVLNQAVDTQYSGFDSRMSFGYYDPKQFTRLPIAMKPGDALISSISAPEPLNHYGHGQPVLAAAILTCLREPVPADAFRPSYCDRGQKIYLARNLHRELLYTLPKVAGCPETLTRWARVFQRPWLDTVTWGFASPKLNMPRYGQWITHGVGHGTMLLHLDYAPADKEPLLVSFVQYGIDLWGIERAGFPGWRGHGGFGQGRKWTLIFSGLMLGDQDMAAPNSKYPKCMFGEDTQTAFGKSWTGAGVVFTSHPVLDKVSFETKRPEDVCGTEPWTKPGSWGNNWMSNEGYRRCCTSVEWVAEALAVHLMRAEKLWNHEPFFAYVDRWMTEDNAATARELKKVINAHNESWTYDWWITQARSDKFSLALWDKYRHDLPPAKP